VTQIVNCAVHLAQPLLIADLSGSLGRAAFLAAFGTAVHLVGTYLAGWPTDRFGARRVLVAATLLRGVVLAGIPVAMALGRIDLTLGHGLLYGRGADPRLRRHLGAHGPARTGRAPGGLLDRVNSRYELAFEVGAVAGPLMLSGLPPVRPGTVGWRRRRAQPRAWRVLGGFEVPRHAPVSVGHRRGPDAVPPLRSAQGP
jgi:MFS family permease